MLFKSLLFAASVAMCVADLRMASQPKSYWKTQQRNRNVPFETHFNLYMEPSAFNYAGLERQRDGGGYDNFLRSNIDNEQDRRNFNTEPGKDHLPFRSYETAANDGSDTVERKMKAATKEATGLTEAGNYILATPGEPYLVPLRWNNPHASELELNVWIFGKANGPYVIPIKKPSCSGEGYQDKVLSFTIPANFNTVASCRKVGQCVLQVYSHSVESRMYASGTPIVIEGGTGAWKPGTIKEPEQDRKFNLKSLRRLCLPSNDPNNEASHKNAVVYKARLSSDVYNHAYQNSDFSPYAGQQPQFISQNMQASCILKMTVGNFGELGKQYMKKTARSAQNYAKKLDKKARARIRIYETVTNSIIEAIKYEVKNNDTLPYVAPPAGSVECIEWRDQYSRRAGGRLRGKDRNGGFCLAGQTCLCHGDCYLGYGRGDKSGKDAYCAVLEADGTEIKSKDENGTTIKDAAGNDVMVPSGKMTVKEGSEATRIGPAQRTEDCFRCAEVGSTTTRRHNTNTYIPSFEIHGVDVVNTALQYIAPIYLKSGFFTHPDTGKISKKDDDKAILQIYMAVLTEMWPAFKMASDGSYLEMEDKRQYDKLMALEPAARAEAMMKFQFTYRGPVRKTTTATLSDANGGVNQMFKKLDADGNEDRGFYSSQKAWVLQARVTGSSTAVPSTPGPLDARIPASRNHADGVASGGGSIKYQMPPPPVVPTACGAVLGFQMATVLEADTEITPEAEDMDSLNFDADCDDGQFLEDHMKAYDDECNAARELNITFVCDEYVEPECTIPGQAAQLPGQMFTNLEAGEEAPSPASTVVPSAFLGILLASASLGLFL